MWNQTERAHRFEMATTLLSAEREPGDNFPVTAPYVIATSSTSIFAHNRKLQRHARHIQRKRSASRVSMATYDTIARPIERALRYQQSSGR